ncbi:PQQ-binding-like beta-propeller repeat protein [Kibdelosporangium aridum]|nr:PQQ-binding-like beta-propeller repeat protein [Kibdelosporangium aridum]
MRGLRAGLGVVLIAAVAAGCGSGNDARTGQSTPNTPVAPEAPTSAPKPPRQAFDPPKVFEKTAAKFPDGTFFNRDKPRATLHDGNIYSVDGKGLNAFDGLTADPLWAVPATVKPSGQDATSAPFAHQDRIYAAFSGKAPAQGTKPARPVIELVAVDVKSGKADWSTTIDVDVKDPGNTNDGETSVVGVSDTSVVVTYYSQDASIGQTFVVDASTHQVRWNKDQFLAGDVDSGVIVGNAGKPFIGEQRSLTGLAETDGAQKWSTTLGGYGTQIMPLAPKIIGSSRQVYSTADYQFDLIDVTSGKSLYSLPINTSFGAGYRMSCFYDQTSMIVCDGQSERTFAFDVNSIGAKPMWEITKTTDRVPPSVTAAYHGLVYGTGANAPVTLDAKTGQDAPDAPGVAPEMVDKYLAVYKGTSYKPTK